MYSHQKKLQYKWMVWRQGGLVVSTLDFRSGSRWFERSLCRRVVSSDKKLYSTLSLFTQVYKWVPMIRKSLAEVFKLEAISIVAIRNQKHLLTVYVR